VAKKSAAPPSVALPSSPASPTKAAPRAPGVYPVPASTYASLRSPLPLSLLVGYTAGPGVSAGVLLRAWEGAALADIFAVSVDSSKQSGRVYLRNLAVELAASDPPAPEEPIAGAAADPSAPAYEEPLVQLSRAHLDSLIMERCMLLAEQSAGSSNCGWMLNAYRKAQGLDTKLQEGCALASASSGPPPVSGVFPASTADWQACIETVRLALTCLVRYIGISLSDEEMLQNSAARAAARAEFARLLCSDPAVSRTLPVGLLDSLVSVSENEDTLDAIFKPLADELAAPLPLQPVQPASVLARLGDSMPSMDVALPRLHGLVNFFRFAPLAQMVVQHPAFLPKAVPNGRMLQGVSTLGVLLSLGASSSEPGFHNVLKGGGFARFEVENEVSRLRASFGSYQMLCAQLFRNGVKHGPVREALLQWLSVFVRGNIVRRRMQYHPLETSSDQLFFNVLHVCLLLCGPIVKKSDQAALEKVNLQYLLQTTGQRVDYDSITRIQATLADVKVMRGALSKPIVFTPATPPYSPFNFVTEIFFLTHEVLHEGLGSIVREFTELMQEISRRSRQMQSLGDPSHPQVRAIEAQLDQLFSITLAIRVHLQDSAFLADVIAFYDWTALWIRSHQIKLLEEKQQQAHAAGAAAAADAAPAADASAAAAAGTAPAVATAASHSLSSLIPEPMVETLVEFFTYLGRFQSEQLQRLPASSYGHILELVCALAAGPFALKNPHLRASLAEFLLCLLPEDRVAHAEHVFNAQPLLRDNLVPVLLELYVSVEDGRGMYYAKFNARHNISTVLQFLWEYPSHRSKLISVANDSRSGSLFVRFTNLLINDLIFLLDEALKQLAEIRAAQIDMDDTDKWMRQPQDVRTERERAYHQSEQGATSCLMLANATVHMLFYLSAEVVGPFLTPEFVERMAHLLDNYLVQLVGPKISQLKVRDRERYHFRPRELLQEIVGIWLHLAADSTFLEKVAADERSYKPGVFAKAARILRRRAILPERQVQQFEVHLRTLISVHESMQALEDILGDVPDEYLDALMGTLMSDPVQLPQSKQFVDRATIQRQLLNKQVDPFSNTPLTAEQLIDAPKLKEEIARWVDERKAEWRVKQEQSAAAADADGKAAEEDEDDDDGMASVASSASASTIATAASAAAAPGTPEAPPKPKKSNFLD